MLLKCKSNSAYVNDDVKTNIVEYFCINLFCGLLVPFSQHILLKLENWQRTPLKVIICNQISRNLCTDSIQLGH